MADKIKNKLRELMENFEADKKIIIVSDEEVFKINQQITYELDIFRRDLNKKEKESFHIASSIVLNS